MNTLTTESTSPRVHDGEPPHKPTRWNWPGSAWFCVFLLVIMFLVEWSRQPEHHAAAHTKAHSKQAENETGRNQTLLRRNRRLALNFSGPSVSSLRPNSCAPYSMAVALHAINKPVSYQQICREVEFANDGVPISRIVSCLNRHAVVVRHRRTSPDELLDHIDTGNPALVLFYFEKQTHLVACVGYQTNRVGRVGSWQLYDTAAFSGGGGQRQLSHVEFCRRVHRPHTRLDSTDCCASTVDFWLAVSETPTKKTNILDLTRQANTSATSNRYRSKRKSDSILDRLWDKKK